MGKFLSLLSISTFVLFKGNTQTNNISNSSYKKTSIESLQGTWVAQIDKQDVFKIERDSIYYFSGKRITQKSALYLSNKCTTNKDELVKSVSSGHFLIVYNPKYDDMMCYEIEALTERKLNLFYEGKTLIYIKQ